MLEITEGTIKKKTIQRNWRHFAILHWKLLIINLNSNKYVITIPRHDMADILTNMALKEMMRII